MIFTSNHLTRFYWVIVLIFFTIILSYIEDMAVLAFTLIFYLIFWGLAIHSISRKVIVSGHKITSKNLFYERSIQIFPESRIYIRKNLQSFNFVYRHYDYVIKIINPHETLKINANVNDADELYQLVAEIEQNSILPVWLERYHQHRTLKMDDNLTITPTGIKYKNKSYLYQSLTEMELDSGYFRLKAEGKLWQKVVLALPVSDIPNLITFMALINQDT